MVAARVLERIGHTLVIFASILFASLLVFVVLVALARVEPYYSTANIVEQLATAIVISTAALIGGIIAVVAAKVRESAPGQ